MNRIILYIVGAAGLLFIGFVGYLIYLTQRSVVADKPDETTFDETGPLVNGFAIVTKQHPRDLWGNGQNRYGFIDAHGKRITYVNYRLVNEFAEGRAYVRNSNERCGFIDTTGREIIPLVYVNAGTFMGGRCLVQKDEANGFAVGFIDRDGREVTPFRYTKYAQYSEGFYPVGRGPMNEEKWGYVDAQGTEIVPPTYDEASSFYNGFAVVGRLDPQRSIMRSGLIDTTGREVLPCRYTTVEYDPTTQLVQVSTSYQTPDGRWQRKKGKVNLTNEVVEPLIDVPD